APPLFPYTPLFRSRSLLLLPEDHVEDRAPVAVVPAAAQRGVAGRGVLGAPLVGLDLLGRAALEVGADVVELVGAQVAVAVAGRGDSSTSSTIMAYMCALMRWAPTGSRCFTGPTSQRSSRWWRPSRQ